MAEWKMSMSYNYNPSYHAYACGLMYPQGPEQAHPTMSWGETAYGPSAGVSGGFYSQPSSQSPPGSPARAAVAANGEFPSAVVYYADTQSHTQSGRLFLSHNRVPYDLQLKDQDPSGTGRDTPSDSEAHTPDSWSSGSSREGGFPPVDNELPHWAKRERGYELDSGSPDGRAVVSSSLSATADDLTGPSVEGDGGPVVPALSKQVPVQLRKAKARTAFSEGQMNALTDRFNVQRYLTPAEMKTLAGLTGLTYKQVKTWFQNRRMKLKRHQKDNSWVSERYISAGIPSTPVPHSQVNAPVLSQDLFTNSQFRESVFRNPPQQTPLFSKYSQPLSPSQVPTRPQGNWPLPPSVMHYEFPNPAGYVVGGNSDGGSDVNPGSNHTQLAAVHNTSQWSS